MPAGSAYRIDNKAANLTSQLFKLLKRAAVMETGIGGVIAEERARGDMVATGGPRAEPDALMPSSAAAIRPVREVQRRYAARALELMNGNYTATAKTLGVAPNTLRAYLKA